MQISERAMQQLQLQVSARARGFTMIELLIVIAILGILTAIAVPSYSAHVQRARHSEAMGMLSEVAGEQERYFSENNTYAAKMADLGYGTANTFSTEYYTISINLPSVTSYVLTAAPIAGKAQASDTRCASFTLSSTGARGNTGTSNDCW